MCSEISWQALAAIALAPVLVACGSAWGGAKSCYQSHNSCPIHDLANKNCNCDNVGCREWCSVKPDDTGCFCDPNCNVNDSLSPCYQSTKLQLSGCRGNMALGCGPGGAAGAGGGTGGGGTGGGGGACAGAQYSDVPRPNIQIAGPGPTVWTNGSETPAYLAGCQPFNIKWDYVNFMKTIDAQNSVTMGFPGIVLAINNVIPLAPPQVFDAPWKAMTKCGGKDSHDQPVAKGITPYPYYDTSDDRWFAQIAPFPTDSPYNRLDIMINWLGIPTQCAPPVP
jgi:hypothetical protein